MTTIQDLEQQLGIQLTQQTDITSVRQFHTKCGYCCNEREEVIALAIIKTEIESIHLPASFQSLRYLNLGSNAKLKSLTFEGSLPHLEHLDISDSALESLTLPYSCGQLKWLDVSRNQIQYQILFGAELPNLKYLDVSGNQLTALELPNCPKLQYLYAADNQIDFLEIYSTSKELEVLHLRNNKLEVLPNNLLNLMALNSLYLHGNPLSKLPAEVISQDERGNSFADVRNHLLSIAEDGAAENDEIKLVLLGNSTAGKTSLLRYLTEQQYDESLSSTHGIQNRLCQAKDKAYFVNIWDFGG
ncbi:MAG: leucine-rich repeat domain-containing protein [Bacteroidota bacterium]